MGSLTYVWTLKRVTHFSIFFFHKVILNIQFLLFSLFGSKNKDLLIININNCFWLKGDFCESLKIPFLKWHCIGICRSKVKIAKHFLFSKWSCRLYDSAYICIYLYISIFVYREQFLFHPSLGCVTIELKSLEKTWIHIFLAEGK